MYLITLEIVKSNKINILKTSNLRYNYNKIFINFISINFTIICCFQNFNYLFSITKNTIIKPLNFIYSSFFFFFFFFELKLIFFEKKYLFKTKKPNRFFSIRLFHKFILFFLLFPYLSFSSNHILCRSQFPNSHRPTSMQFLCGNSDFSSKTEFSSVRKSC